MNRWQRRLEEMAAQNPRATVHDLDRHAAEKDAGIVCWRFLLNGVEMDFASGATLTEAFDLLGCGSDDTLEALPITEESKPLSDEEVSQLLDRAAAGLNLNRAQLCAELSDDDLAGIRDGEIPLETVRAYAEVWASRQPMPKDDRRYCHQCMNLQNGYCLASARGELRGARKHKPFDKVPRRCVGYLPGPDDPDQRSGCERWPELANHETDEVTA